MNPFRLMMNCPSGLFYDISTKMCNVKETIAACGGCTNPFPSSVIPAAAPSQPVSSYSYSPPTATVAPLRDVPVESFCAGKVDGVYSSGCEAFYQSCSNGYTFKMACPSGLVYDIPSRSCDRKENVVACGGTKPYSAPAVPSIPAAVPATPMVTSDNFCAGKTDGIYTIGDCATGLFFDVSSNQCEYREKVVACGGSPLLPAAPAAPSYPRPSATVAPAAAPAAPVDYSRPAVPPKEDKPVLKDVNDRSCTGQKDGFYGEGCNPFFYSCLNGAAYKMACPTGLFYDLELQSCEYKGVVPNCGGRRIEVTATPSPSIANLPRAPVDNSQCNGKKDGIYPAADCSQEYISCQAGLVRKENCQTGLIYNQANQMCDYRENVAKCSARSDVLPTRAPTAEYGRTTSSPIRPAHDKYDSHKAEYQKKPALSPVPDFLFSVKIRRRIPRESKTTSSEDSSPIPTIPFNPPLLPLHHRPHPRNGSASRALALILVAAPICQALTAISVTTFSKPLCTLEQI
ncbi:hypothetical protein PMAYCL1PPCAC_02250, partial [Pristionchus mayeri]